MADISWGEAVGGGIAGLITGIGATFKALTGDRRNGDRRGNGVSRDEFHALDKRVLTLENKLDGMDEKLDEIRKAVS